MRFYVRVIENVGTEDIVSEETIISVPVEAIGPVDALSKAASAITAVNPKPQEIEVKT